MQLCSVNETDTTRQKTRFMVSEASEISGIDLKFLELCPDEVNETDLVGVFCCNTREKISLRLVNQMKNDHPLIVWYDSDSLQVVDKLLRSGVRPDEFLIGSVSEAAAQLSCMILDFLNVDYEHNVGVIKVRIGQTNKQISCNHGLILWVQTSSKRHELMVRIGNWTITLRDTIRSVVDQSPDFIRINQSVVVNRKHVLGVDKKQNLLTMKNGDEFICSRKYIMDVEDILTK